MYDEEGDTASIITELVTFIKLILLFENIYYIAESDEEDSVADEDSIET